MAETKAGRWKCKGMDGVEVRKRLEGLWQEIRIRRKEILKIVFSVDAMYF